MNTPRKPIVDQALGKPMAPDSLTLRMAILALAKDKRLSQADFAVATRAIASLARLRRRLENLGIEFEDAPR